MAVCIDTWGWIALCDKTSEMHALVTRFMQDLLEDGERFVTSNFVFGETITLAFSHYGESGGERILDGTLATLKLPQCRLEEITPDRFQKAVQLRRRYRDKPRISFTDLTTMVVMRELGITDILTADRHFAQVNLGFRLVPEGR